MALFPPLPRFILSARSISLVLAMVHPAHKKAGKKDCRVFGIGTDSYHIYFLAIEYQQWLHAVVLRQGAIETGCPDSIMINAKAKRTKVAKKILALQSLVRICPGFLCPQIPSRA
jgi:hypothetical protein